MPFEITWLIEKRLVLERLSGVLTPEELEARILKAKQFLESGQPPVHYVIDMREVEKIPLNLREIRHAARLYRHPALGWTVTFGISNRIIHTLVTIAAKTIEARYRDFATQDEAIRFLYSLDPSLPLLPKPVSESPSSA